MNKKNSNLKRIIKMLFSYYPVLTPLIGVCIVFSAIVSSIPSIFTQNILELIEKYYRAKDWSATAGEILPLVAALIVLYVLSTASIALYNQLGAKLTQGFLDKLRRSMFDGMQNLPIKYFDTRKHGDIMSYYTNDTDALRQLISQALPAVINSGIIVLCVLGIMLYYSVWMTLVVLLGVTAMLFVSKKVGGGSAKYFIRQQEAMGKTEGFVQEMMNGQKVIKSILP